MGVALGWRGGRDSGVGRLELLAPCTLVLGSRLQGPTNQAQGTARRRNLGGNIAEPGLYAPAKERVGGREQVFSYCETAY